ncbi:MAG: metallophosphoesterase [Candidatus Lokiarchaeota archaeon]|nr:metallophosphoesterase [Candidatus Harpocratesius repetitus]
MTNNQLEWLREDLSRNQNMWKFVYMHVPMYSTGDYGSNIELVNQLEPIFEENNVNAVFYGHDHHFESFYVNHTSAQGIYYFVIGTDGAGTDDLIDKNKRGDCALSSTTLNISNTEYNYNCFYGSEFQIYGEMNYAYIKVNVLGNQATFSVIRSADGSEIIKFTQTK